MRIAAVSFPRRSPESSKHPGGRCAASAVRAKVAFPRAQTSLKAMAGGTLAGDRRTFLTDPHHRGHRVLTVGQLLAITHACVTIYLWQQPCPAGIR